MDEGRGLKIFSGQIEDYPVWKRGFLAFLTIKGLDDLLEKNEAAKGEDTEDFRINSRKLYAYIISAVDERTADSIESRVPYGDGSAAWKIVRQLYERVDTLNIANLRTELAQIKLSEDRDVEEYISKIRTLARSIRAGEGEGAITDKALVAFFLKGLPDSEGRS